jgi:hypothetical protein
MDKFVRFPKIPRWTKAQHYIITEKIDGTNAQIFINDDCTDFRCGSRNRWITPEDDNHGFAAWCEENRTHLLKLGKGHHFGEWWGQGIQRGYGLQEKKFSLFNVLRWNTEEERERLEEIGCVDVVPVIYTGPDVDPEHWLEYLDNTGSLAAPGFMDPEGIVIYQPATRQMYKKTFGSDDHKYLETDGSNH